MLTQTTEDLTGENRTPGQKGYVIGKIVFEVASFLLPFTKAGTLMQVTKSQVLAKLIGKTGLLKSGAHNVATLTKAALDVTQMCFVAGTLVKTKSGLMKIEEVQAGMWVWSRDEFTQQEGWKQVRQTFITHPSVLYRLTYELRGPPQRHLLSSRSVYASTSETLGVTAPHPFWVSNREKPGFVAAEELRVGDELLVDDRRQAVVTGKTLEMAPADESFTTYNFEVADFHTYFAGESSVWVHNHGAAPCMLARSTIEAMVKRGEATWDAFRGTLTKASPGEIGSRTRLKIFNETRQKYLTDPQWQTGTPPWENLPRQLRGLGPAGSDSYWDQINGVAGNPKLLGNNLRAYPAKG